MLTGLLVSLIVIAAAVLVGVLGHFIDKTVEPAEGKRLLYKTGEPARRERQGKGA
jgi:hypothetical protein